MPRSNSPGRLATRLAIVARDIAEVHGDLRAQTAAYALLMCRWDTATDVCGLLDGFYDAQAISRIENALDCREVEETRLFYEDSGRDAAVYFYESFLRAYDPERSKKRGVVYTPPEVIGCMVDGVEVILRDSFGVGIEEAKVIDPCCGVGAFLRFIELRERQPHKMVGVELMPAACAIAQTLLKKAEIRQVDWLSEAFDYDTGGPIVILGNPPYSGHSSNAGKIADLMRNYREGIAERNPKWLQDDYVKFIRMAQHHIEKAGRGIVAFITNHSYLFNPTFKGMRSSLAATFDDIRIIDLGGNVKQRGAAEENVFPIQVGVAIAFFVRTGRGGSSIRYANVTGSREEKLRAVESFDVQTGPWSEVSPIEPFHLFIAQDSNLAQEYYGFCSMFEIYLTSVIGFVTSRDKFAIGFSRQEVQDRIGLLRDGDVSDEKLREKYGVGDLDIDAARSLLRDDPDWEMRVVEVLYRPFDYRWAYHCPVIMERPRLPLMGLINVENPAIAVGRAGRVTGSDEWDVVFAADRPTDLNLFRRGGARLFPGYIDNCGQRQSNVKMPCDDPAALTSFIYAILHSGRYRARYAEFLRADYPRIPIPEDQSKLQALAHLGSRLFDVHLMREGVDLGVWEADEKVRIGGYVLPDKYINDRAAAGSERQIDRLKSLIRESLIIRKQIDDAVAEVGLW